MTWGYKSGGISPCCRPCYTTQVIRYPFSWSKSIPSPRQVVHSLHSPAFDNVFDNGNDFIFGQAGIEKDCSTMLGKALFAHFALQEADIIWPVCITDANTFFTSNAVFRALFIVAKKLFKSSMTGLLIAMSLKTNACVFEKKNRKKEQPAQREKTCNRPVLGLPFLTFPIT